MHQAEDAGLLRLRPVNGAPEAGSTGGGSGNLPTATPARSGQHLVALDGLRGIAAIWVVFHHLGLLSSRGYLAVDFFFCLSGYIIGLAYEKRLQADLTVTEYMKIRLFRLYPMLFIGGLIGLALAGGGSPLVRQTLAEQPDLYWPAVAGQFLLIPYIVPATAFLFNTPQWSIVFELVINFLHALLFRWLSVRVLVVITVFSAAMLIVIAHDREDLSLGANLATFLPAIPRVTFGFTAGVLLFRLRKLWLPRMLAIPFGWLVLVLVLSFAVPTLPIPGLRTGGRAAFSVIVLYPLIVAAGAKCNANARFAVPLGLVSYPLYAIHYPIVEWAQTWIAIHAADAGKPALVAMRLLVAAAVILLAWAMGKWVESPFLKWRQS